MAKKTTVILNWDENGRIRTAITGASYQEPKRNLEALIAPNAILLLAHQLGVFKPSIGLKLCDKIYDIIFNDKQTLVRINSVLKELTIDTVYRGNSSATILVHPKRGLFTDENLVEKGMQELINNFFIYIYKQPNETLQFVFRTTIIATIHEYYIFIQEQIDQGMLGKNRDLWTPAFNYVSARMINGIQSAWIVPRFKTAEELVAWKKQVLEHHMEQKIELLNMRDLIKKQVE